MSSEHRDAGTHGEDEATGARWKAAWEAMPTAPVPEEWQATLMASVRERGAASRVRRPSLWWGPLAAAALLALAFGAAAAAGINPRRDLTELAVLAGDSAASVLRLPEGR
jgi:hypothetical protein